MDPSLTALQSRVTRRPVLANLLALAFLGAPATAYAATVTLQAADWTSFRDAYMAPDGRVIDREQQGVSHTESQGFGMLLAEAAGDRAGFDRIWGWTQAHLARPDLRLFAWRFDPAQPRPVADLNNATDGDLFIAWTLLRASKRWHDGAYEQASAQIRKAIAERLIATVAGRTLLLPGLEGFTGPGYVTYNPSYFVLPALQAFARQEPDGPWRRLIDDGLWWAGRLRFGRDGLTADWVRITADGQARLAPDHPPRFGFDALRAPFYLVWGGYRRNAMAADAAKFWGRRRASAPPAWVDLATGEEAPYPLSTGALRAAELVSPALRRQRPATADAPTYYSMVLARLAQVAGAEEMGR